MISSRPEERFGAPDPRFVIFCREICLNPPKSIELIINGPCTWGNLRWNPVSGPPISNDELRYSMTDILQPLSLFRNVSHFTISGLFGEEMSLYEKVTPVPGPVDISEETMGQLESMVKGESPVKFVFRIYEVLFKYALAFETNEAFRVDMAQGYIAAVNGYKKPIHVTGVPKKSSNPFLQKPLHPVEGGFRKANRLSKGDNLEKFFEARNSVLDYLERQYLRIAAAASATADYVKGLKRRKHLFDPAGARDYCIYRDDLVEGMLVLEDYANAFTRDVPEPTRKKIRTIRSEFDLYYSTQARSVLLKQMRGWFIGLSKEDICERTLQKFIQCFKTAVDDMDSQYLQIRHARRALFDHDDANDPTPSIDLELGRCDERIHWDIYEPNMDVPGEDYYSDEDYKGQPRDIGNQVTEVKHWMLNLC